jgi:ADP-ribose pyrophosphatase YjhB (NUDIX family)
MGETAGFKIRVGVILWQDENRSKKQGRILLCRQNNHPFWVFPGGTLEPGETIAQCAVREIQEEAGLGITLGDLRFTTDFKDHRRQVLDVFFEAQVLSGSLTPTAEENIQTMQFFTLAELETIAVEPALVKQALLATAQQHYLGSFGSGWI